MDFLKSAKFSLICAVVNGVWAFNSLVSGDLAFCAIGLLFCGICTKNYLDAK